MPLTCHAIPMSRHGLSCRSNAAPCHAMPCHVAPCVAMLCHDTTCISCCSHATTRLYCFQAMPCHVVACHALAMSCVAMLPSACATMPVAALRFCCLQVGPRPAVRSVESGVMFLVCSLLVLAGGPPAWRCCPTRATRSHGPSSASELFWLARPCGLAWHGIAWLSSTRFLRTAGIAPLAAISVPSWLAWCRYFCPQVRAGQ